MKKLVMSFFVAAAAVLGLNAQQPMQLTPLPVKAEVKSGVLPNGLTYYILHNEEPKQRANFYIAQKVGSTLENPEQLGLAHFLEHMAFNGTTHYPGKAMLNYLQNKGIRFGADINAYTAFDETVYNINNVPTTDRPLMDSVLLVLRDWSDGIALEESEINAERGVIQEEWRSRNDASTRMMQDILPKIYQEYQYQQMPIGKMEVVMNFPPQAIRDYYHKWYRPDQQGIVIVGDFDAAEMEKKVIDLFSSVVMPENAAERTYPIVSDNVEPIFASFTDKELQAPNAMLYFKYDKTPFEMRNTLEVYVQDNLLEQIYVSMVNERLNEFSQNPDCPYAYAVLRLGDFLVAKTKGAAMLVVVPKDEMQPAFKAALHIVAEAALGGFNVTEYNRAKESLISGLEKVYNERNNTSNSSYAQELIRHFIDNEPVPGIDAELQIAQQFLPMIPIEALNAMGAQILTAENEVIIVTGPDPMALPTEEQMVADVREALNTKYELKVEEVITDPLIAKLPKPGSVKSQQAMPVYGEGAVKLTLSNGVKVIVKPTDFKADEILVEAFREGGKRSYKESDGVLVQMATDIVGNSNLGSFDPVKLQKYLAGKNVELEFTIANYTDILTGTSTVKDLPTLMELIYADFTSLNPNPQAFDATVQQAKTFLANADKNPQKIFSEMVSKKTYGDNELLNPLTAAMLENIDYAKGLQLVKNALSNAADYTFVFTGNVDMETLKPLLEQYIASLPSKKKPGKVSTVNPLRMREGQDISINEIPMEAPSVFVYDNFSGDNIAYNTANDINIDLLGEILGMIYTETLREEEEGTYGASTQAMINPNTGQWRLLYVFQTNDEKQQALRDRAVKELEALLTNGAKPEHFARVKEAALKQYQIQNRKNSYWLSNILNNERGFNTFSDYEQVLNDLTLEQFNKFLKNLYDGKNRTEVVLKSNN